MKRRFAIAALLVAHVFALRPSVAVADEAAAGDHGLVDPEIFRIAREDFDAERFADAAAGFYGVMRLGGPDHRDYEWSRYYLAASLNGLGLRYAATQYFSRVVANGAEPAAIPRALEALETLSERGGFDADLVYEALLHDRELSALPGRQANFVSFVQGWMDLRSGDYRWARSHFAAIEETSSYALRAKLALAIDLVARDEREKALPELVAVVEAEGPFDDEAAATGFRDDARLALARLHFEAGRPAEAWTHYEAVTTESLSRGQAHLLLEKAWTAYLLGRPRKAMGLLHALKAPSYEGYFLPDAYLLRALIFKDHCHYLFAKRELRAFGARYERIIGSLGKRVPLSRIAELRRAATEDGGLAVRSALIREMKRERREIEDYDSAWEDVGLDEHLRQVYDLGQKDQLRRWRRDFDEEGRRIADEILELEAQVALLDHEIDLDLFRRVEVSARTRLPSLGLEVPFDSRLSYYEHDGEFWNDELHDYRYFLTDRCFRDEEGAP